MDCRACGAATEQFLSLGQQPLPNRFLLPEQLDLPEPRYPLELYFCPGCGLVQLGVVVPPEELFSDYLYASSTSALTREHFEKLASYLRLRFGIPQGGLVVDLAANDGILLRPLRELGLRAVGVEPATNLCQLAWHDGLHTFNEFFTQKTVERIGPGTADMVTACNVFAHVDDIRAFTENVKRLLKPQGVFVLEVQYLGSMVKDISFDNMYLEHLSYFTLSPLVRFFASQGMQVIDVSLVPTHGGSLRLAAAQDGARTVSPSVAAFLRSEKEAGLQDLGTFKHFAQRVEEVKERLPRLLAGLNGLVAGYGAAAKSSTILNYCQIGPETVSYIVDDSPLKQGRWTPLSHIPIVGPKELERARPDCILVLAWNYLESIKASTS